MAATVDKALGNTIGVIVDKFIKTRGSTIFGHPVYFLDRPGPSLIVSVPHEEFFITAFNLWIGGKNLLDEFCRPIMMHGVYRALGMIQFRVEHILSLLQEVSMRREIVLPRKYGMSAIVITLKKAEIKSEDIPVYAHKWHTETQQLKDNNSTPTVMVYAVHINKTTTIYLPTE